MSKVKYGMIGFGGIAENRIAKEGFACDRSRFAPLQHAELVAATDINAARQSVAEGLGLKWYADVDSLLAAPEVQAVFVATNNLTHASLAAKALRAGKPVIVEKPLATTVKDAEMLVALAAEKKLSLSVDHMMVYNAWNIKAKEVFESGVLGEVNDSCFHMEFAFGYDPAEAASWRCAKVEEMGGPIGDVASHCFYMAEFIFQKKICKVAAVYLPKLMAIAAEDGAYIKFEFEDGSRGSVKVAFSEYRGGLGGTLSNLGYELYGSEAVLRSYGSLFQISGHPGEPIKIRLELDRFDGKTSSIVPEKISNIYQELIEHHARSIQTGKHINAEDGAHNLRLCEAAHQSARQGGKMVSIV
ncbi:MAG: Gfo/Idh/MocA family oxidoreductase [Lentisphaerae bacterium]|nr:Gfo/Idh/MocA family oxidoreductase [Lentisphaerota bacterium]